MSTLTGVFLVLATWGVLASTIALLGLGPACLLRDRARCGLPLRTSLWWGLLGLILLLLAFSPFAAAGAPSIAALVTAFALLSGAYPLFRWLRMGRASAVASRPRAITLAYLGALSLAIAYLAFAAMGPVTHFDAGLYQLGAVRYAAEFPTLRGLALLQAPFGYSNSATLLGGFLSGAPWGSEGFRLLNGLVFVIAASDLAIRLMTGRFTWGTYILLAGVTSLAIPFLAMADFWMTSPTSDTAILFLTLVSVAYLADFLSVRDEPTSAASVALAAALMACTMRPTAAAFAVALVLVIAVVGYRRRHGRVRLRWIGWALPAAAGLLGLGLLAWRDYLLSGWLGFPLAAFHWEVPWLATDPTGLRHATLAAARDPGTLDGYQTAHSWSWIIPWLSRLPEQWEPYFLMLAFATALLLWLYARRSRRTPSSSVILLCTMPSIVAAAVWFTLAPPSFRFGWGPIFTVPLILIGGSLSAIDGQVVPNGGQSIRRAALAGSTLVLVLIVAYCALARSQPGTRTATEFWGAGGLLIPYTIAPVTIPETVSLELPTGLVVTSPKSGSQCWAAWPLCTYQLTPDLALQGSTLSEGFIRR